MLDGFTLHVEAVRFFAGIALGQLIQLLHDNRAARGFVVFEVLLVLPVLELAVVLREAEVPFAPPVNTRALLLLDEHTVHGCERRYKGTER